jgi:CheY-like chemotaxis protein
MKVIIADDNAIMRKIIHTNLKILLPKSEVLEVEDGKSVIENLESSSFKLIFLDLNMPNLDGFDVLRFMVDKNIKDTEVIIISGELTNTNIEKLKKFKIKYIVEKPFDTNSFNQIIHTYLEDHE